MAAIPPSVPKHIRDSVTNPEPIYWQNARDMDGCGRLYNFHGTTLITRDYDGTLTRFAKNGDNSCINLETGELFSFCRDGGGLCSDWRRGSEVDYDGEP